MKKLLALIVFSVVLLVPVGAQNAFAVDSFIQVFDCTTFQGFAPIQLTQGDFVFWENAGVPGFFIGSNSNLFPTTEINAGDAFIFQFTQFGTFPVFCGGADFFEFDVIVQQLSGVDSDGDFIPDAEDNCVFVPNRAENIQNIDPDGDGIGQPCDNHPTTHICGANTMFNEQGQCVPNLNEICGGGTTINNMMCVVSLAVGGYFVGIEHSALLLQASQITASWMIPVIVSGIGIAIVIARKF